MKIFVTVFIAAAVLAATPTRAAFPADVTALMDTSVDPCDDFYQYTCGRWLKNYTLEEDEPSYSYSFGGVTARNEPIIQDILKQDWPHVGEFYESCMAFDALSALGNEPLQENLARIKEVTTKEQLAELAGSISISGPSLFTDVGAMPDPLDATRSVLYVTGRSFVLPDVDYYTVPDMFATSELPFREYISTLITLAGIDSVSSGDQGDDVDTTYAEDTVITIEKALAAIYAISGSSDRYMKYSEAVAKYPLTFHALAKSLNLLERSAMTVDSKVLFPVPDIIDGAEVLFETLDLEDLKLYYAFVYVHFNAPYLGDSFVQARFDLFGRALDGLSERPSREKVCSDAVTASFPDLLGKYYFLKTLDTDRKENVMAMVKAVQTTMGEHIKTITWLDDATREEAAAKLAKIANLIGHSTKQKSYPFVLTRDNYFANVHAIRAQSSREQLARIYQPVDRTVWDTSALQVNAHYSPLQNKMVFPAAILQPPFFSGGSHPVQNFGAIGVVIGHELTHGYDTTGAQYDGDGNKRDWWTAASAEEFEARARCMANQYSEMVAYGDSGEPVGNVDGNLTIGENIADNGGVSLAFDAYHNWAKSGVKFNTNDVDESEVDKLFFVSYGQMWCRKSSDETLETQLVIDAHSPAFARVNGVAMNSDQFAKTFKCKAGSKMNPKHKCKLW